ncbi:hypothetical protein [Streptomyces sp. WG-D5]
MCPEPVPGVVHQRPRYFPRQLVTPAELNLANQYFMDRMRRHNRLLHGWGVVCGAVVRPAAAADGGGPEPWKVVIAPGCLLDPQGNEILIEEPRTVDLRTEGVTAMPDDPPGELDDPWCAHEPSAAPRAGRYWVAVRYEEALARPVRVEPAGCGCSGADCEYSRWSDGYRVRFLSECPPSHRGDPPPLDELVTGHGPHVPCPVPEPGPWVVLATVDVAADGAVTSVDHHDCRRMAPSLAPHWWRVDAVAPTIRSVTTDPPGPHAPGAGNVTVTVHGTGLAAVTTATLGGRTRSASLTAAPDGRTARFTLRVHRNSPPGPRTLTLTTADGTQTVFPEAVTVGESP